MRPSETSMDRVENPRVGAAGRRQHDDMLDTATDAAPALEAILAGDCPALAAQPIAPLHGPVDPARRWVEILYRPASASAERVVRLAEGRGYGERLDLAVLDAALAWVGRTPHVARAFINITSDSLRSLGFPAQVLACLARHRVEPRRVCLEVSERDPLDAEPRAEQALVDLASAGVGIAIDDYGVGCANTQLLTRLQPVALKIDLNLVQACLREDRRARGPGVLNAIAAFADALDIPLVAEGVETDQHRQALRRLPALRLAFGQGYALGRPEPIPVFGARA